MGTGETAVVVAENAVAKKCFNFLKCNAKLFFYGPAWPLELLFLNFLTYSKGC